VVTLRYTTPGSLSRSPGKPRKPSVIIFELQTKNRIRDFLNKKDKYSFVKLDDYVGIWYAIFIVNSLQNKNEHLLQRSCMCTYSVT
jgi:hypothetical protein